MQYVSYNMCELFKSSTAATLKTCCLNANVKKTNAIQNENPLDRRMMFVSQIACYLTSHLYLHWQSTQALLQCHVFCEKNV